MENLIYDLERKIRAFMARSLQGLAPEAEFNDLALELFRVQRATNPAYAKLLRPSQEPADWREIPAAPTFAFKELDLTSIPIPLRERVFHSSGTTVQKPSRHFHFVPSLALYEESVRLWFAHSCPRPLNGSLLYCLTPRGTDVPHSSLAHMFETIAACRPIADVAFFGVVQGDTWTLDIPRVVASLQSAVAEGRPVALFGTAFLFVNLVDQLQNPLQLPPGSWIFETGGYKGRSRELSKSDFYAALDHRLGISRDMVFAEYGMSELSSQAYDRADGKFRFPPWAKPIVVSPETGREALPGQPGMLRIVDLANVWSVAAVQTEDLAMRLNETFTLLGRAPVAEARGCSLTSPE